MSQIPPSPYGNQPPPPPYGQGGQGYPQQPYGMPQTTSGTAIASLVLGILMCIPFVTGLLAAILGIVGIRATRSPAVKGRGLAIAGLVLGVISVVGWTAYFAVAGAAMYALMHGNMNPLLARAFFTDLQQNNVAAARGMCASSTSNADLQATADQMRGWGPITAFTTTNTSIVNTKTTMDGTIQFQTGGSHTFDVVFDKTGSSPIPQVQSWDVK